MIICVCTTHLTETGHCGDTKGRVAKRVVAGAEVRTPHPNTNLRKGFVDVQDIDLVQTAHQPSKLITRSRNRSQGEDVVLRNQVGAPRIFNAVVNLLLVGLAAVELF